MSESPPDYPHIVWRRLKRTEQRGKANRPMVPPRPPVRPSPGAHRSEVGQQADHAVEEVERQRRAAGVAPDRMIVLEMEFLQASQRELLEKLGIRVLDEGEEKVPLDPPHYSVPIKFDTEASRAAFEQNSGLLSEVGALAVRAARGSQGEPHPRRVVVCFESRERAADFWGNQDLKAKHQFATDKSKPKRESTETRYKLVVEFPDRAALDRFRAERSAGGLSAGEYTELYDAIDDIRALTPVDRMGGRLTTEGIPDKPEFTVDVDLWHPGDPKEVGSVIRTFRELVSGAGGRVTDGPTGVAQTFFLARVKGSRKTLDAILNYDRVALADLPPTLPAMPSTVFQPVAVPEDIQGPAEDTPVACVVDSGVLAGHPLLRGWVLGERDFDSGDGTEVDLAGHGTHTAGVVVYGDVHRCVQENRWDPKVRIVSAKVLMNRNGVAEFAEDNDERIETQFRNAIAAVREEYGCRVFNLSLGHFTRRYLGGRQLPWALVLDELARELDVVLVVSAGNVPDPDVPEASTEEELQRRVLDQLLTDEHALIDPACSMLALTVGSIARSEHSRVAYDRPDYRPPLVGAPADGPSPFTRTGLCSGSGAGPGRAVKPELVAYGGNYYLDGPGTRWKRPEALLGEPSLNLEYTNRLLKVATGTSVAAPYVTHTCARVEHELRQLPRWRDVPPSGNLIRAVAVHSARISKEAKRWAGGEKEAAERWLRLLGYGMPNAERALRSTDEQVLLLAEDLLEDEHYHVYELEIPSEFLRLATKRRIRVTLAYDPPVRGTRKDYLVRKLYFRLTRQSLDEIDKAAKEGRDCKQPDLEPGVASIRDSTVQSACYEATSASKFGWDGREDDANATWYVVVRSDPRLDQESSEPQRYALVVSFEHTDKEIRLYNRVKNRVELRVKQVWG